ncbi:MAG: DUF6883 domain-containing protein [Chthoniobacterales bacterium]
MKLPNASNAFVDLAKLRDYSLSETHEEGKNKARVFWSALEIDASDAEWLRDHLLAAVLQAECKTGRVSVYGRRYSVDFLLRKGSLSAMVRRDWMVRGGENFPRLTSCYVL